MDMIKQAILEKLVSGEWDFEIVDNGGGNYSLKIQNDECEVASPNGSKARRKRLNPEQAADRVYSVLPPPESKPISTTEAAEKADLSRSTVMRALRLLASGGHVEECSGNEVKHLTWRRTPVSIKPGEGVKK